TTQRPRLASRAFMNNAGWLAFSRDCAVRDVRAVERAFEVDALDGAVGQVSCVAHGVSEPDRAENAAAVGDDGVAFEAGAGVEDLRVRLVLVEPGDRLAFLVGAGVAGACDGDADCGARVPVDRCVAEAAVERVEA